MIMFHVMSCSESLLVSGSSDNTGRIWSLESLECLHVLEGHTDAVNAVAIKVLCVTNEPIMNVILWYK